MQSAVPADSIELSSNKITHTIVSVSSDTARRWLKTTKKNRPIGHIDVERYRRDMRDGLWRFAADPIRFDADGHLIDGQHRLTALSELPGTVIQFLVIRGLPTETQKVMDQGRKRTPGQQLYLSGVKDANLVASVIKVVMLWETGLMFRDTKLQRQITTAGIEDYVAANPEDVAVLTGLSTVVRSLDAPPSVVGAFAVIASRQHHEDVSSFLKQLHSMVGMSTGHPVHTLDRRLRTIRKKSERVSNRDYLALFIQAFNAFHKGRNISQFLRPKGGSWTAETFPVVTR